VSCCVWKFGSHGAPSDDWSSTIARCESFLRTVLQPPEVARRAGSTALTILTTPSPFFRAISRRIIRSARDERRFYFSAPHAETSSARVTVARSISRPAACGGGNSKRGRRVEGATALTSCTNDAPTPHASQSLADVRGNRLTVRRPRDVGSIQTG